MHMMDEFLETPRALGGRKGGDLREELDIAARHEAAARTLEHDNADTGIGLDTVDRGLQPFAHVGVERVHHLRPVEGQGGDAGIAIVEHGLVHGGTLPSDLIRAKYTVASPDEHSRLILAREAAHT